MKLPRRQFLHLVATAAMLPAVTCRTGAQSYLAQSYRAQSYPSRPVHIIVGFAPGGPTDMLARLTGQWLSARFNQQFIIENRPGASGNLATDAVANAAADGHTLLMVSPSNMINATLYDNLKFDFIRDVAPVASILRTYYVMEVNPTLPVGTISEFIAYAKARPGRINMASAGTGTPQHVAGEMFRMMTGVDMIHVPYRGAAPALTDLLGGQVQIMFDNLASSLPYVRAGKLRPLGVTTAQRSPFMPEVPTIGELVPGFEASAQFGIGAPKGTPPEIVERLNREINAGLADPDLKARLVDLGGTVTAGAPTDFAQLIAAETQKWGKIVRAANLKAE